MVVSALLQQSRNLQMLALGERHGSEREHALIKELIHSPGFTEVFPVIVVEFGNARYQDVVDRYVAGNDVSDEELRKVWQDTTVPMAWDSPLYAEFFRAVRDRNQSAANGKKVRVLLGDPPIDWSKVDSVETFRPYMDRDAFYAEVMTRNCEKGRCLLICGTNHFYWKDPLSKLRPASPHKNALEYYIQRQGEKARVQSVLPVFSDDKALSGKGTPGLLSAHEPPLDKLRFGQVDQSHVSILRKIDGQMKVVEVQPDDTAALSDVVDWVLYLGPADQKVPAPAKLYQDRSYIKELYRRSKIVGDAFGFDLTSDVKEVDPDAPGRH